MGNQSQKCHAVLRYMIEDLTVLVVTRQTGLMAERQNFMAVLSGRKVSSCLYRVTSLLIWRAVYKEG